MPNQQSINPFDSFDSEEEGEDPGMRYTQPNTSHMTVDSSIAPRGDRYLPEAKLLIPASSFTRPQVYNKAGEANMDEKLTELELQVSNTETLGEDDPNRPLHSMLNRGEIKFDFEIEPENEDGPHSTTTSLELNPLNPGRNPTKGKMHDTYSTRLPVRHSKKGPLNGFRREISPQILLGPFNHRQEQPSRPSVSVSPQNEEVILEETDDKGANGFSISILDNLENCIELVCGDATHHSPLACMREPLKTGAHKNSMNKAVATRKNEGDHSSFAFGEESKGALKPKENKYRNVMGKILSPKKDTTGRDTIHRSEEVSFNFKSFETDVQSFSISGSWDNQEQRNEETASDLGKSAQRTTTILELRVQEEVIQRNRLLLDAIVSVNHASYRLLTTDDLLGVDMFGRMVQGNRIAECYLKGTILRKATMSSPIVRSLGKGIATITYLRIDEVRSGVEVKSRKLLETRIWKKESHVWVNCQFQQTIAPSD